MSKFKIGDKVRCIDNHNVVSDLTKGFVYRVTNTFADQVELADVFGSGWWEERFELANEEKFLEDAYDKPCKHPSTYFVSSTTTTKKQSVHQLAAETFSALSGKPLSENDVKIIVELVEVMEKL